jgi:spore coat protein A
MKKKSSIVTAVILLVFAVFLGKGHIATAAQTPQIPLAGNLIPQFVDPLPGLYTFVAGTTQILLNMEEFQYKILPNSVYAALPAPYNNGTYVWGYRQAGQATTPSYIGPVIAATRGIPTEIKFVNNLGTTATTNVLAWLYSTDQTMHWADPLGGEANDYSMKVAKSAFPGNVAYPPYPMPNYSGPIPAVVHLHGGEVPPSLDGGPDAWFTSDGNYIGHGYYSKDGVGLKNYAIYRYPNSQEPANIWFHDHVLGITRLNVYAGMAGAYVIKESDPAITPPADLNDPTKIIPLVIQDRMFDTNGQLFFPADTAGGILWSVNPEHPYWVPEFLGDVIVVNGKAWPYLEVGQNRYRFLFLNGSNARTYEMWASDPVTGLKPLMWVIGTDGGYLNAPAPINKLVMMPGERYDVIMDFSAIPPGTNLILKNTGRSPFPKGAPPQGATVGQIMQFRVVATAAAQPITFNPAAAAVTIRGGAGQPPAIVRLPGTPGGPAIAASGAGQNVHAFRQLTLNEVMQIPQNVIDPVTNVMTAYPGGPLEVVLNNTKWSGERVVLPLPASPPYTLEPIPGFTPYPSTSPGQIYYSELPSESDTELWEIINLTADAHPIHLHLVQFQVMDRQNFNFNNYNKAYGAAFPGGVLIEAYGPPLNYFTGAGNHATYGQPILGGNPDVTNYLQGRAVAPGPEEQGWKDTVISYPSQVLRLVVRWAPTDKAIGAADLYFPFDPDSGHGYVWHCHIIDHEDNEMMRPTQVQTTLPEASRTYRKFIDY